MKIKLFTIVFVCLFPFYAQSQSFPVGILFQGYKGDYYLDSEQVNFHAHIDTIFNLAPGVHTFGIDPEISSEIEFTINAAKWKVEECLEPEEGIALYKRADELLKEFENEGCSCH